MLLKELAEDFVVEEVLERRVLENGPYCLYRLTKRGLNTEDAIRIIARRNHVQRREIGYAGSKDKRAVTTQYITVPSHFSLKGPPELAVEFVGHTDQRLVAGDLKGNNFCVVVRDLPRRYQLSSPFCFLNLFGPQRFGAELLNVHVGKTLVQRRFAEACGLLHLQAEGKDFLAALRRFGVGRLRFFVHAFQSWLWNQAAIRLDARSALPDVLPVAGFLSEFSGEAGKVYQEIFAEEGIQQSDFLLRSVPELASEGWERVTRLVTSFEATWDDDLLHPGRFACTLSFFLSAGSYATVFVPALFSS